MRARLQTVLVKLESLTPGWVRRLWCTRFGKNSILSTSVWLLMFGLFYVAVSRLDVNSQQAKLIWSPLGAPMGLAIQWAVFEDRLRGLRQRMSIKRLAGRLGWRFITVKVTFFFVNQIAYGALLVKAGLPYWAAAPTSAATVSIVYYLVCLFFVTASRRGQETMA